MTTSTNAAISACGQTVEPPSTIMAEETVKEKATCSIRCVRQALTGVRVQCLYGNKLRS